MCIRDRYTSSSAISSSSVMESILKDSLMPRKHINVNEMVTAKLFPLHYFVIKASVKNKYRTDAFAFIVDVE